MSTQAHLGELALRRLRAGELEGEALSSARAHADGCGRCGAVLRSLDDEQRRFEAELPFERFAAGVARAGRRPSAAQSPLPKTRWLFPLMAAAAMVTLVLATGPVLDATVGPLNRAKGGAQIALRVAAGEDGPQRTSAADVPEPLAPGERVRIGYQAGSYGFVAAISVDAEGVVTPLYPERGQSLPAAQTGQLEYLPGSLEFTGQGAERVFVVLTEEPVSVESVEKAARRGFERAGRDLAKLTELPGLPGEQLHRTVLKP